MMKEIQLGNIKIRLLQEKDNVRVVGPDNDVLLVQQSIPEVAAIVKHNFEIVSSYYLSKLTGNQTNDFDPVDISIVSLSIVLNYLFMYNSWRIQYQRKKYDNLEFKHEDFDHAPTHDIIFHYYRKKSPEDWDVKCSILMGMTLDELRSYYKRRELYYNK
jgi:hypothetical protein